MELEEKLKHIQISLQYSYFLDSILFLRVLTSLFFYSKLRGFY